MVDAQKQQADAFNALADATHSNRSLMHYLLPSRNLMVGIRKRCAIWMGKIDSLCVSTGRNLRMELLNRAEGDVMTMLAGMNEELDDEDVKEELIRCFSDAPTTIH